MSGAESALGVSAFTVFALGLRHGADPDHLAAIDNLTRNSIETRPFLSRFVGSLFALGHSVMVIAIAALVGLLGERFAAHSTLIETIGTWLSIAVLVTIALLNMRQLWAGNVAGVAGFRSRMLPKALRNAGNPLVAIPVGLLFGFGFETSSQIAAYSIAFAGSLGVLGAIVVGVMFCIGMLCTDTLDSVLVHRLVSDRSARVPRVMRVWIWSVTILALLVALYQFAQLLGWKPPFPDIAVSAALVGSLLAVFAFVFVATRKSAPASNPN